MHGSQRGHTFALCSSFFHDGLPFYGCAGVTDFPLVVVPLIEVVHVTDEDVVMQ